MLQHTYVDAASTALGVQLRRVTMARNKKTHIILHVHIYDIALKPRSSGQHERRTKAPRGVLGFSSTATSDERWRRRYQERWHEPPKAKAVWIGLSISCANISFFRIVYSIRRHVPTLPTVRAQVHKRKNPSDGNIMEEAENRGKIGISLHELKKYTN